jgi:hypothetical protein
VTDVVRPVLLHYPAEKGKAVGTAMVVAPGGGFRALMMSFEGADIARRLNAMGVDAQLGRHAGHQYAHPVQVPAFEHLFGRGCCTEFPGHHRLPSVHWNWLDEHSVCADPSYSTM